MKKTILFFIIFSIFTKAQMSLGSYQSRFGKTYNLELTQKKFILVDVPTVDVISDGIHLKLSFNKAKGFKERMTEAKNKYAEWKLVAEKNNVKEFYKKLKVDMGSFDMAFRYGQNYHFARNVDLVSYLVVDDTGVYWELKNKYIIMADHNQFIKSEGFSLEFADANQMENFINSINLEKGEDMYRENRSSNKLFE